MLTNLTVVNKRTHIATPRDLYIGRPSRWGNPFAIGRDGNRTEVIAQYEQYLLQLVSEDTQAITDLQELGHYRFLVCWCAPLACHGDILIRAHKWSLHQ